MDPENIAMPLTGGSRGQLALFVLRILMVISVLEKSEVLYSGPTYNIII